MKMSCFVANFSQLPRPLVQSTNESFRTSTQDITRYERKTTGINIYEATWFADRGMVLFQENTWPAKASSIRQAG
jgi:hypothetical protein